MSDMRLSLPRDFLWGVATSAFQIEGSPAADGRGQSVWDVFTQRPGAVEGGGNGSIACDHYRRWPEDIDLLSQLGVGAYRFSLSWSRIMPDGHTINQGALDHYRRLVEALLERDIQPMVTLNHWDMPQALMDEHGGWAGRESVETFRSYCLAASAALADSVTWWVVQNEPWIIALLGYQVGLHAPGIADLRASVAAGHHVLLGHGAGADAIRAQRQDVRVSSALSLFPCDPATDSEADREAAHGSDGYVNRWYLDPLLKSRYPEDTWEHYERAVGELDSIIRPGDVEQIGGRMDFLGINYYTRRVMRSATVGENGCVLPWQVVNPAEEVPRTDEGWEISSRSLGELLRRIRDEYANIPVVVTENGSAFNDGLTHDGRVHDSRRICYLEEHLAELNAAVAAGAQVIGYMHWSLMDNFEWALGYRPRFGLVHTDYPTCTRTPKDSFHWYRQVITSGDLTPPQTARSFG